jgi:hypothetical protein
MPILPPLRTQPKCSEHVDRYYDSGWPSQHSWEVLTSLSEGGVLVLRRFGRRVCGVYMIHRLGHVQ